MNVVKLQGAARPFFVVRARAGHVRCGDVDVLHEDVAREIARSLAEASGLRAIVVPDIVHVDLVEPLGSPAPAPAGCPKIHVEADGTIRRCMLPPDKHSGMCLWGEAEPQ